MKAVIQRVSQAKVQIGRKTIGQIQQGIVVLVSIGTTDTNNTALEFATKIIKLTIFEDKTGKISRSVKDTNSQILLISQFTLHADLKKGKRPSFSRAQDPNKAKVIYEFLVYSLRQEGVKVATGEFGAEMKVTLTNEGPVTYILNLGE